MAKFGRVGACTHNSESRRGEELACRSLGSHDSGFCLDCAVEPISLGLMMLMMKEFLRLGKADSAEGVAGFRARNAESLPLYRNI